MAGFVLSPILKVSLRLTIRYGQSSYLNSIVCWMSESASTTLAELHSYPGLEMSVPFINMAGLSFELQDKPCSSISIEQMHVLVERLNKMKDHLGCVVFPRGNDDNNVVIIFAGATERFFALSLAVGLDCEVIYFQDLHSWWYQGSDLLPPIDAISSEFLKQKIGSRRPIFIGQSSGGYASLVAARYFDKSVAIACSPQAFSDVLIKGRITFVGITPNSSPQGLVDLADHWSGTVSSERYVAAIFSGSEAGNPLTHFYWMDHIHSAQLAMIEGIELFVIATDTHSFLHGRAKHFSCLLNEACATPSSDMSSLIKKKLCSLFGDAG